MTIAGFFAVASDDNWAIRRRIVVLTLLFCAGIVLYSAIWADVAKAALLVNPCFTLSTFVIGYYVFGPVLDDHLQGNIAAQLPQPVPPADGGVPLPKVLSKVNKGN